MESTYTTKQGDVWDKIAYDGKQFPAAGNVRV